MKDSVICVENLYRDYETTKGWLNKKKVIVKALAGISFEVKKGEIFGLLGPNGAGKTTTIKILSTLLAPTSGESRVLGYKTFGEENMIRQHINFIFGGELGVYRRLSGRDNLVYFSNLYKIRKNIRDKRIDELLELVGLSEKGDLKVETYSKGMIQRLQIARGLINDPEIIYLDEPTIGLDPIGARELRDIIKELSLRRKTILLTTHYMHEADELCDRIAIINKGKIVALDTPVNLKKQNRITSVLEINVLGIYDKELEEIKKIEGVETVAVKKNDQWQLILIQFKNTHNITQNVLNVLKNNTVISVNERGALLEDAYVRLVGGSI
ncbi:ABC transporter ATP-binding protein [Alkaliphilus serpentinus]|uniref:ABC transporter ATP-binding protein n=1 Tax=Alkaliphilus serpentinus TaxID=1482731 RepID=A0A833HNN9_9FIRM|nr:ABC transporter ATP-binding protein [Alkaliphilus serpentinus]KAB3529859.1 ABC transporter ATP-binding protein [Alkaliphilus serpentinus]